ncbi:tetratricopeptide repeat protein [Halarcobacter ebronensis]|uniref:beta-lactamase n=1 Tax=Halarcobacter ebronensis TaxID=1462615 RepID=A0A4V1LZW8_9BACT|nr:tetratricopeptide repeat protein [Halarcobacter ebronensis]QKF81479.1 tetratricopeptide repeat protein [Halarcobacter ebronensis]RXK02461.1 hypothetical protein CRV07_13405 [Halarcobacter ebronensis]
MKKTIITISLIIYILVSFTACNDDSNKKEEIKSSLTIPEWDEKAKSTIDNYWSLWNDAKKDPMAATSIGYAYSEKLNDYEKAIEWYKYSNSMKPLPETSNYACYSYQQLKQYEEAIKWCEDAINMGSKDALTGLGYSYSKLKQYDNAIKWYKKAYENDDINAMINLGTVYLNKKDYKNSELWYKKAIEKNDYEAYQGIAKLYHDGFKDDIKASAYAIAVINTKYTKSSVLRLLKDDWNISKETIKKGYELQLTSDEFPIKYKGDLGL